MNGGEEHIMWGGDASVFFASPGNGAKFMQSVKEVQYLFLTKRQPRFSAQNNEKPDRIAFNTSEYP